MLECPPMGTIFEYNYQVGEVLRYQHTTSLLFETPPSEPIVGRASYEHVEEVLSVTQGGIFSVEIRKSLISGDGPLAAQISPELNTQVKLIRVDRSGRSYDEEDALPTRVSFPVEPIDAGTTWSNNLPGPGGVSQPIEFSYIVERVERQGEETLGFVVCQGQGRGQDDDGPYQVEIRATSTFSVTQGCQLGSQTVVTTTWESGTKSQAVVELALLGRATRQLTNYEA